jgi:hypothetical protein
MKLKLDRKLIQIPKLIFRELTHVKGNKKLNDIKLICNKYLV